MMPSRNPNKLPPGNFKRFPNKWECKISFIVYRKSFYRQVIRFTIYDLRFTNMNVFIIGSLALDYIMNFSGKFSDRIMEDKIHSLSLSFLVDSLKKQQGGTGM